MITTDERNYLLASMKNLLTEYEYPYTEHALNSIIDEWYSKKAHLIEAFKKHPQYKPGKFMIAFDSNYERVVNPDGSRQFFDWLNQNAMEQCRDTLPDEIKNRKMPWQCLPNGLFDFLYGLYKYAERCLSNETAELLDNIVPELHAHAGEKTSRAIGRLCRYLGYDKVEGYNAAFAKYADSLSPMTIKRHTVLSLNPLDYLTMSFGNSWASCHTIDKTNKRDMPNSYEGQYSSGTMSYMLDGTSMVLYTVDSSYNGSDYWDAPKITRQMFHWGEEKLIQGRLYPQDNDGCSTEYTAYRGIVQQIMSTIFDFPNFWTVKKGYDECSRFTESFGTHYADYVNFNSCNVSRIKGSENENTVHIGANPMCPNCGNRHDHHENISCCGGGGVYYCAHCGEEIYGREDLVEINGRHYCHDCAYWCDICECYHVGNDAHYIDDENITVCPDCLEEKFKWCRDRHKFIRIEDAVYLKKYDIYVHKDDADLKRYICTDCGKSFLKSYMRLHNGRQICNRCDWWFLD